MVAHLVVLRGQVANDVIAQEGHPALRGAGLWRDDVEVACRGVGWHGVELDKCHLDLNALRPDILKAGRDDAVYWFSKPGPTFISFK